MVITHRTLPGSQNEKGLNLRLGSSPLTLNRPNLPKLAPSLISFKLFVSKGLEGTVKQFSTLSRLQEFELFQAKAPFKVLQTIQDLPALKKVGVYGYGEPTKPIYTYDDWLNIDQIGNDEALNALGGAMKNIDQSHFFGGSAVPATTTAPVK